MVGYFSAPASSRNEVLRIIATVLDFKAEDRCKVGLDESASHGGWTSGIMRMARSRTASGNSNASDHDKVLLSYISDNFF